ncbi:MAG TPA: ribosome biogenesis GTP-binding protein YihA/YsxC [Bacteroidales bacterium]|jgi:GTP-binding protein|nr:ribosome biogenesis GTP-binding protein YihA/YsxC [Bacteroidales bacterium]
MIIHSATYLQSSPSLKECPDPLKPEFGFIGRSNVGKSSLINMLTGYSHLARTSGSPGKTRSINHYLVNGSWFLVDLPGYGYARVPVTMREKWIKRTEEYILGRENLICLFVLIDSRHNPQKSDIEFMEFLGINQVPFARIFTKSDKISSAVLKKTIDSYDREMLRTWESLPPSFTTSAVDRRGREDILDFIGETLNNLSKPG